MSNLDDLRDLERKGALYEARKRNRDKPSKRQMYMRQDVHRWLYGEKTDINERKCVAAMRMAVAGFIEGNLVIVATDTSSLVGDDLKALKPHEEGVWEFRSNANPTGRLFGRFTSRNLFIATSFSTKGGRRTLDVSDHRHKCRELWAKQIQAPYLACNPTDCLDNFRIAGARRS